MLHFKLKILCTFIIIKILLLEKSKLYNSIMSTAAMKMHVSRFIFIQRAVEIINSHVV